MQPAGVSKSLTRSVKVTEETYRSAQRVAEQLEESGLTEPVKRASTERIAADFAHFLVLTKKVINQTQRRVIDEERVPAEEKVVSVFEEHTDIIRKDRRETLYGHKVCLTGGSSWIRPASRRNKNGVTSG